LAIGALLATTLVSCNKIKNRSKKLQMQPLSGNVYWKVKSLKINGQESVIKGDWIVSQTDIYDTIQTLAWVGNDSYGTSNFEWQFQDKAKFLQLNHRLYCDECDGNDLDSLDFLSSQLTGRYDVVKQSRKRMIFECSETTGFSGQTVEIELEGSK